MFLLRFILAVFLVLWLQIGDEKKRIHIVTELHLVTDPVSTFTGVALVGGVVFERWLFDVGTSLPAVLPLKLDGGVGWKLQ